jgi:hypothetical protein
MKKLSFLRGVCCGVVLSGRGGWSRGGRPTAAVCGGRTRRANSVAGRRKPPAQRTQARRRGLKHAPHNCAAHPARQAVAAGAAGFAQRRPRAACAPAVPTRSPGGGSRRLSAPKPAAAGSLMWVFLRISHGRARLMLSLSFYPLGRSCVMADSASPCPSPSPCAWGRTDRLRPLPPPPPRPPVGEAPPEHPPRSH